MQDTLPRHKIPTIAYGLFYRNTRASSLHLGFCAIENITVSVCHLQLAAEYTKYNLTGRNYEVQVHLYPQRSWKDQLLSPEWSVSSSRGIQCHHLSHSHYHDMCLHHPQSSHLGLRSHSLSMWTKITCILCWRKEKYSPTWQKRPLNPGGHWQSKSLPSTMHWPPFLHGLGSHNVSLEINSVSLILGTITTQFFCHLEKGIFPYKFCSSEAGRAACICTHSKGESRSAHTHPYHMYPSYRLLDLRQ